MRLIIVGGGGFGLELYTYIEQDILTGALPSHYTLGVIDDSETCEILTRMPGAHYLGRVKDYEPSSGDQALISIGSIAARKKVYKIMRERGVALATYIHPSAWVAPNAKLGEGVIVCPNAVISACADVENNVAINVFCGVGHGAHVGMHTMMGPYSVINGDTSLGEGCFLGSRASLFPGVSLGRGCSVDAHTAVKVSVGDFKIISVKGQYIELENRMLMRNFD